MDLPVRTTENRARRGSGLVLAMIILLAVGTMMYVSTDSVVSVYKQLDREGFEEQCKSAAEAVAASKEEDIVNKAALNDPTALQAWTTTYGVQWFGNCQVKWRIEPFLAYDSGRNPTTGAVETSDLQQFIVNYNPSAAVPVAPQQVNNNLFHFRVVAEAQYQSSDATAQGTGVRAQAFRWSQVNVQNLFKYALFYAQEGRAGDIEMSPGPNFSVAGGVHSNGAIYIGGSSDPTVKANLDTGGITYFGPKTVSGVTIPVVVTGIDGIFRQRKKTNYLFLGGAGYPDPSTATTPDPTKISDNSLFMTQNNRYINSTTDAAKLLTGSNDSRTATWKTDSMSRWGGWVRSRATGATVVRTLSNIPQLAGRPFEPQQLSDAATEAARTPVYWTDVGMTATTGTAALSIGPEATPLMEDGIYVDYAMGTKETGGRAYTQFSPASAPGKFKQVVITPTGTYPLAVGLLIRELPAQVWPTDATHSFTVGATVVTKTSVVSATCPVLPSPVAANLASPYLYYQQLVNYVDFLRSQYQVIFGTKDLSWAFFSYRLTPAVVGEVFACNEDQFYNRRLYWSQNVYTTATMPKQNVLTLNMDVIQSFIKTQPASLIDASYGADLIKQHFNGLIYMHRTNRGAGFASVGRGASTPETFLAAFRLARASTFNWNHTAGVDPLGTSKTTIVTPNPIFLWGDFNLASAATDNNVTPVAVMADSVTVLSNSWSDANQSVSSVLSGNSIPNGNDTTYNCALVTNNWPVDPDGTYQNQYDDASTHTFVWWLEGGGRNFNYLGSVVVLNSRRYARGYNQGATRGVGVKPPDGTWPGQPLYGAPTRFIVFNEDLSSGQGRPPYVLDGYNVSRVASYVDVVR